MTAKRLIDSLPSSSPLWNKANCNINKQGYRVLYVYDPNIKRVRYKMEHILIYERAHGICVPGTHCIHHLNGIPDDNRVENLLSIPKTMHTAMHAKLRRLSKNLAPAFYNIKRHAIIQQFVDRAREHDERKARWGV